MKKRNRKTKKSTKGLPPGSLVFTGEQKTEKTIIDLIEYKEEYFKKYTGNRIPSKEQIFSKKINSWVIIKGLHEIQKFEQASKEFDIHPLILEDILNTNHIPKIEFGDDHIFAIFKIIDFDLDKSGFQTEQISILAKNNCVFTFLEKDTELFEPLLDRMKKPGNRFVKHGAGYLFYALIDILIDDYFLQIDKLEDDIRNIEKAVLDPNSKNILQSIHNLKSVLIDAVKTIRPLRDIIRMMQSEDSPLIDETTSIYIRDLKDHAVQIIDHANYLKDSLGSILETFMSYTDHRMNEIMKVLTVIATVFIPLTFIAGVYGMNFKHMPELEWEFGYGAVWILMFLAIIGMVFFFKRKKWF